MNFPESLLQDNSSWLVVAAVVVAPYVLFPLLLKGVMRFRRDFTLASFDMEENLPPREVAEFLSNATEQLQGIGFRVVGHYALADLLPNVMAMFALHENRNERDAAMAVVMYGFQDASQSKVVLRERHVEFSAEFGDGTEVSTNNNKQESSFKPVERRRVTQFPDLADCSVLYRAHQRLIEQFGHRNKRALPTVENWPDQLRSDLVREFDEQIDTGYLRLNSAAQVYQPTWKGAYLMAWKLMWPISFIRRRQRQARAKKLLDEFALDWQAAAAAQSFGT